MSKTSNPVDTMARQNLWRGTFYGFATLLFFTRFFLPAESAAQGETLWIAGLWMICGIAWAVALGCGGVPSWRLDRIDGAVAVWILGQVAGAGIVILHGGDKRSAANLGWEWIATGIVWLVARHGIVEPAARRAFLNSILVTGTVLAGYGLYQHYVSQPQLVAEYGPLFDRLKQSSGQEKAAISQKLARAGIPTEGPSLILYEKRLRDSREPMGLFALANTFGGCLSVCLILLLGAFQGGRQSSWGRLIPGVIAAGLIMWCLLLTKSRTAWIGGAVGMTILALQLLPRAGNLRRLARFAGVGVVVLIAAAALVVFAGGLDRQVISEAPKSLAYRFQYWQATARLIADHPWWGVGPGNFRQHYLKYKLPEASEEINDPHNLFFETAATGGLISVLGLVIFLGLATYRSIQQTVQQSAESLGDSAQAPTNSDGTATWTRLVVWAAGGGTVLAFLGMLICFGEWSDTLLVLAVIWPLAAWFLTWFLNDAASANRTSLNVAARTAAIVLMIHLLGAGGIGMPGVSQLLVLLLAFGLPGSVRAESPQKLPAMRERLVVAVGVVAVLTLSFAGFLATAFVPVLNSRSLSNQGMVAGWNSGMAGRDTVFAFYQQAAVADSWSPEPWKNQFEWTISGENQSNETFDAAVKQLLEVHRRDPVNFWAPRQLGVLWLQRSRATGGADDAAQSVEWLEQALERYPTNSAIRAQLAFALVQARDSARAVEMATGALAQDEVYRTQGHVDRYLEESLRTQLQSLIATAAKRT
jgi:O-antigen ligase